MRSQHINGVDTEKLVENISSESGPVPRLSLRGLSRVAKEGQAILDDCSLDIPAGQIWGIIGPSGSGKSTLLRAVNRLWEPAVGTVFLDGADITKESVVDVRRKIGMLFQTPALFEGTVADNVSYGPALRGQKLTISEVEGLLEQVYLDSTFADKTAKTLSGGQAQRVALARTLANYPEVLLLDEPTSALDPAATRHVEETIVSLQRKTGLTVLWVSHSLEQVRRVADVAVLLVSGRIVSVCRPSELSASKDDTVALFLAGQLDSSH